MKYFFALFLYFLIACDTEEPDVHSLIFQLENERNTNVEAYRSYLTNPNNEIVLRTLSAIANIQDSVFFDVLIPFLNNSDITLRNKAIFALGQIKSLRSFTVLYDYYKKTDNKSEFLIHSMLKNIPQSEDKILLDILEHYAYPDFGFDLAVLTRAKFKNIKLWEKVFTRIDSLSNYEKSSFLYAFKYTDKEFIYDHFNEIIKVYNSINGNSFEEINTRNYILNSLRKLSLNQIRTIQKSYDSFIENNFTPFLNWRELNSFFPLLVNTRRVNIDKKISLLIDNKMHDYSELALSQVIHKLKLTKSTLNIYISAKKAVRFINLSKYYSYETLRFISNYFEGLNYSDQKHMIDAIINIKNKNTVLSFAELIENSDPWVKSYFIDRVIDKNIFDDSYLIDALKSADPAISARIAQFAFKNKRDNFALALINTLKTNDPKANEYTTNLILNDLNELKSNDIIDFLKNDPPKNFYPSQIDLFNKLRITYKIPEFKNINKDSYDYPFSTKERFKNKARYVELIFPKKTIKLKLRYDWAPLAASNFVHLIESGFYNNTEFHRVIPDFVLQSGDNRPDGEGGPNYKIRCEYSPVRYKRGIVGMARYEKDTATSQFYIMQNHAPHLTGKYTAFAEVLESDRFLDSISPNEVIKIIRVVY